MKNIKKKINIYIPLEIFHREFYPKIILIKELINLGFRVYFGDKKGI